MAQFGKITYNSGFFNHSADKPRKYDAEDMVKPYDRLVSNGVCPNDDGTISTQLQVEYVIGMKVKVNAGKGIFAGHWFDNDADFEITLSPAEVRVRYDAIYIVVDRLQKTVDIKVKELYSMPQPENFGDLEYCLGYVEVGVGAVDINGQEKITDTRGDVDYCGFITGIFNQFDTSAVASKHDAAFTSWFNATKDTLSGNGIAVRLYSGEYITSSSNQKTVPVTTKYYNPATDNLLVYINGMIVSNYTIEENTTGEYKANVVFNNPIPVAGTKIHFDIIKGVKLTGEDNMITLSDEVGDLQTALENVDSELSDQSARITELGLKVETAEEMAIEGVEVADNNTRLINQIKEHHYYCTGTNDNIAIGNLVRGYYSTTKYSSVRLVVHGTIGISTYSSGTGAETNPYAYFNFYNSSAPTCRVIVDFSDCSEINIPAVSTKWNVVFSGNWIDIYDASVVAKNVNATIVINSSTTTEGNYIKFEKCRFDIIGFSNCVIAYHGDFTDCYGRVANATDNSWCFNCKKLVRLFGGEYLAYHTGSGIGAVMFNENTSACGIMIGVNCPERTYSGYSQDSVYSSYAEYDKSKIKEVATITRLPAYVGLPNDDWDITDPELDYNMK